MQLIGRLERSPEMDLEYDLLERRSDGVLTWRGAVQGLAAARMQARRLALETGNECFAVASDGAPARGQEEELAA